MFVSLKLFSEIVFRLRFAEVNDGDVDRYFTTYLIQFQLTHGQSISIHDSAFTHICYYKNVRIGIHMYGLSGAIINNALLSYEF